MLPFDVFEDEVRLTPRGDARIEEFCDVGVGKPRQDGAFPLEPLLGIMPKEANVEQLDRNSTTESPVAALRQPDAAHASMSDLRQQRVHAHGLAGQGLTPRPRRLRMLQESPFG